MTCLSFVFTFCSVVHSDDWPQFLGKNRNGESENEKLLDKWPKDGPKKLWSKKCGQGYAGVAVKDDRVYLFHLLNGMDTVECLSADQGKPIWKSEFKSIYAGGATSDLGPRCVPLVHGDSVYCLGAAGTLRRLRIDNGKELWSKNLFKEYRAGSGYFGAGSAPIIVGETIIVIVGGREAGIVGLDLDGKERWKTESDTASYAAPIQLTFQKKQCVACVSKYFLSIVEVATGKVITKKAFGERGPTVNAASPLICEDKLFLSASYRIGARMLDLASMKTVWENDQSMSSQYTTCIFHRRHLFGSHGREDYQSGTLRCVRCEDGKVAWENPDSGTCHLIKVGERALVWNVEGNLQLIRLNPEKFDLLAEARIFKRNSKSLPALSNGRLFLKSNGGFEPGELVCLAVGL